MEPAHEHALRCLALKDEAFISAVLRIDGRTVEASSLDPKVHALVGLAATLSLGAPPVATRRTWKLPALRERPMTRSSVC